MRQEKELTKNLIANYFNKTETLYSEEEEEEKNKLPVEPQQEETGTKKFQKAIQE